MTPKSLVKPLEVIAGEFSGLIKDLPSSIYKGTIGTYEEIFII